MVIIVIFVFAMSVSCAADTNNASISEDNSQMLVPKKIVKYCEQMKETIQTYVMTFLIMVET